MVISAHRFRRQLHLTVADNGRGLPGDFNLEAADRLGLQIVRTLATGELGGSIEMRPRNGGGTEAVLGRAAERPPLAGRGTLRMCPGRVGGSPRPGLGPDNGAGGGPGRWRGTMSGWKLTAIVRRFVARRHVDYGRVRSAICPAC